MERNHRQPKVLPRFHLNLFLTATLTVLLGSILPATAAQPENAPPVLTFKKVLKGSLPEYVELTVDSQGSGTFEGRKLSDKPNPSSIKLSRSTTQRLFELADALGDFKSLQLESRHVVANMGLKTFGYEDKGQQSSVEFNYTEDKTAQELQDMFEGIASVEEHIRALEYSERYDPLGLPKELSYIKSDLENKNLTDPALLAPILRRIASNPRFLHIAQARAQDILDRIPSQQPHH
jgi:hypothetical protein